MCTNNKIRSNYDCENGIAQRTLYKQGGQTAAEMDGDSVVLMRIHARVSTDDHSAFGAFLFSTEYISIYLNIITYIVNKVI